MKVVIDVKELAEEVRGRGIQRLEIGVDEFGEHIILVFRDGSKLDAGEYDEELERKIDLMLKVLDDRFYSERLDLPRESDGFWARANVYGLEIVWYCWAL